MMASSEYRLLEQNEKMDIAFLFQAGTVWPSWESVYKACLIEERINVRMILVSKKTVEASHNVDAENFLVSQGISFEREEDVDFDSYIPHIVIIQFPYDAAFHTPDMLSLNFKLRGSRVVYIPYGIEISDTQIARKDHFNSRVVENAWRIYTSSKGILDEYLKYCRNREAVRVTGSPKFDSISNREEYSMNPEFIKKANGRKIIIWKMHFPKKNNVDGRITMITPEVDEYLKFAKKMATYTDLFFVVMPHPKILGKMTASDSQGDDTVIATMHEILNIVSCGENSIVDTAKDYRNSLYNADAIIMDRSAVMIEAAMLDIPVIIMKNESYDEPMTLPVQEVIQKCFIGTKYEDMVGFVDCIREKHTMDVYDRTKVVEQWFPYLDGKCGIRIVDDMINSVSSESNREKRLQIILYGTGEVSSYYMKDEGWGKMELFNVVAVSDTATNKWGQDFFGYQVIPPGDIRKLNYDYIVIMTEPHFYDIQTFLINDIYLSDRKIVRLDEFVAEILNTKNNRSVV